MANQAGNLPSGLGICATIPDIFYIPELIFGGLVWCLVASTYIYPVNPQGWVMFVSVFCFVMTFLWMFFFACGTHHNRASWAGADFAYHAIAAFFYLSAAVSLASTLLLTIKPLYDSNSSWAKTYKLDIAAVVFAFVSTLVYFLHAMFSALRWKSF